MFKVLADVFQFFMNIMPESKDQNKEISGHKNCEDSIAANDGSICEETETDSVTQEMSPESEASSDEDEEWYEACEDVILHTFCHSNDKSIETIIDETHSDKLIEDLKIARQGGLLCDITLLIGAEKSQIRAHRLILAMKSEYFRIMFTTNLKESVQSEIHLPKDDLLTMKSIVDFAYSGEVQIGNGNIEKLTRAANFYGMPLLFEKCAEYLEDRIDTPNCIEILEFAELITDHGLKDLTKDYIIENFEDVSTLNLDIMNMSTSLLLEIIANDSAAIDPKPSKNEERLFQLGWNHLQAKSGDVFQTYLPKLLKAVHLPQVSVKFLCNITQKIESYEHLKTIIEEANHARSRMGFNESTANKPRLDESLKWSMCRFQNSGKCSVTCKDLTDEFESSEWYGMPVFIEGIAWCLNAKVETIIEGPPVKYLSVYLGILGDSHLLPPVTFKRQLELVQPGRITFKRSHFTTERYRTYDKNSFSRGYKKFMKLSDVFADYYDYETDSCTIIAHIGNVTIKSEKGNRMVQGWHIG